MEIVIVVLLAALIVLFLWYILQGQRRWKEQGDALTKMVGEKVAGGIGVFGEVRERLGELSKSARNIEEVGKDISSLQDLLRAPKFRGGFGELLLERLLADTLPRKNYSLQHRFKNGETVDAVIRIGGNMVPIDSKFPLADFERIFSSGSEGEQANLRRQFTRTIKNHIDNVTKYILPDENTFDFALMYIPAENVYYETILRGHTEESEIYAYSLQKKVIPVSPNSFYAYLQVIILGLNGLHIEKTARDILGHLGRLQGDLGNFQEDYATLGAHIGHASRKYDEGAGKLARLDAKLQQAGQTPIGELPEGDTQRRDEGGGSE